MIAVKANPFSGFVGSVSVPSSSVRFPTQEAATTAVHPRHSTVSNCNLHRTRCTLRHTSHRITSSSSNLSACLHLLPCEHDHEPADICFSTVLPYISPLPILLFIYTNLVYPRPTSVSQHCPCSSQLLIAHVSPSLHLPQSCHTFDIRLADIKNQNIVARCPFSGVDFVTTSC
jgi:hypothetical protein